MTTIPASTRWATAEDCVNITGNLPSDTDLAMAQATVELHCGRTPAGNGGLRTRDLHWLMQAVAWQAVWLPSQPGYTARVGVTGIAQDGLTATYRSAADQTLAPLAQLALKRCSWMGSRSLRFGSRNTRVKDGSFLNQGDASFLNSGADPENAGWTPL